MSIPSFDARAASFNSAQDPMMYSQSQQSVYRSFPDNNGNSHYQPSAPPQIYTAVYSGVQVYEMEVHDIAVMRRRADSWLNATQILKVAGVDKGKRTKVLEKEILSGEHEKVQGGYGKYQGTWINYQRGRAFCRQYGVEELLLPLLEHDIAGDSTGQTAVGNDTPTKEQAMAANRKRLYTKTQDSRQSQGSNGGTFFQNLSSTASNAISAMNKAARLNTSTPRPQSAPRRPASNAQRSMPNSQESFVGNSQRSMPGLQSERSFNANADSAYISQPGLDQTMMDGGEPPRKRIRAGSPHASFSQMNGHMSGIMREGTPTEPNESFYRQPSQMMTADGDVPVAVSPLPHPVDTRTENKQSLLLDLFADLHRSDYSNHVALQQLSGADLDLPLDQSANTALHWAATLARIPLMRLLISKGASIFRGNIAGETPLMSAVQVNNCLDHTCFPDLLELLSPLIEVRDTKGRTILHHISVASGIKGRGASSKYYLEALLEFLVRQTTSNPNSSSSFDGLNGSSARPLGLMRFMSEMVNARDILGNTALNLAARIGNRSIIRQLLEVQADPSIPNHKGLSPMDFGVESVSDSNQPSQALADSSSKSQQPSKTDEVGRELIPSLQSSMQEMNSQFTAELRLLQDRIDASTLQIRDLSAQQKALSTDVDSKLSILRSRIERKQRIQNLHRAISEMRQRNQHNPAHHAGHLPTLSLGDADSDFPTAASVPLEALPDSVVLGQQVLTYNNLNASLSAHLQSLKARDTALEGKYRKVVSLSTSVPEDRVDSMVGQLLTALESEPENDVGRVREFLKRVEAVTA